MRVRIPPPAPKTFFSRALFGGGSDPRGSTARPARHVATHIKQPTCGFLSTQKVAGESAFALESAAMKPHHHVAALALIVYLMALPQSGVSFLSVPWSALQRTYDTAQECEKARATLPAPAPKVPTDAAKGEPPPKPVERGYYCIATDDPRLKGYTER